MAYEAILLWLHGGGWHSRATEDGAALAAHGLRVVPGEYRLSGEARWPAQLADVRRAARETRTRWPGLPLLVGGDSAGAMLALHLGLRGIDRADDVAGVLAFWPPVDPLATDWPRMREPDNPWSRLLGHRPAPGDPATVDSTVTGQVGNRVPVLLVHGMHDEAVPASQSLDLSRALLAAGHPVHCLVTHGGHALELGREDIATVVRAFLRTVLRAVPAGAPGD